MSLALVFKYAGYSAAIDSVLDLKLTDWAKETGHDVRSGWLDRASNTFSIVYNGPVPYEAMATIIGFYKEFCPDFVAMDMSSFPYNGVKRSRGNYQPLIAAFLDQVRRAQA